MAKPVSPVYMHYNNKATLSKANDHVYTSKSRHVMFYM